MPVAMKTANDLTTTKQIILADCPLTVFGFGQPLLLYPNRGSPVANGAVADYAPVVEQQFYWTIFLTVRNLWMSYAVNMKAKKESHKRFFLVIGARHGTTVAIPHPEHQYFAQKYAIQKMLMNDYVPLPFILKKTAGDIKIKFNFDPSYISSLKEEVKKKYITQEGDSIIIGDPLPGWYDQYRNLYRNVYHNEYPNEIPNEYPNEYDIPKYHKYYNHYNSYNDIYIIMGTLFLMIILIIICFILGIAMGWLAAFMWMPKSYNQ
eukprot:428801_1